MSIYRSIPHDSITRLILASNYLTNIPGQGLEEPNGLFQLRHLALSHNGITSWSCIDALAVQCPKLESLSLTGNPLIEEQNSRAFVVARVGSLTSLNGAAITLKERTDCELFYLSHITQHGPSSDEERFREHPRYRHLCLKHGTPDTIASPADRHQDTLSNLLIVLNIHRTSKPPANGDPISKIIQTSSAVIRVLPSMTLRTLRLKIRKTFGGSTRASPRLYLQMEDGVAATLETEQDTYDLTWWGFDNGTNIFVYIDNE